MNERWSLAAGHTPEPWMVVLLGLCAALLLYEAIDALRRPRIPHPLRLRLGVLGLRLLALGALLALAFELTLRFESIIPAGRRLVVLFDDSASMALPDSSTAESEPAPRSERVRAAWQAAESARTRWAEDGLLLDLRAFNRETRPLASSETTKGLTFDGAASDLARALTEVANPESADQSPVAGIVVISDGLVAPDETTERHLTAVASGLEIPITTVAMGAPVIRDVSVASVQAEMFAFVENVTEFEATLIAHGYENAAAEVQLRRNGKIVAQRRILLRADGIETPVRFDVAPDRIGQFIYEIAVLPREGEATEANNAHAFVVKVLRDKVRVLHVAGRPDWDVRSLRTLLRRDPNVELLSYYILRGTDDIARDDADQEELSLIPFPTDELFQEELGSFDLVLLHNFDAVRHQVGRYLQNIAQYVLDGGALVLIGGDLGLAEGGYASPEISRLLPIAAHRPAPLREESFRPRVTEAGLRHPITGWLSDGTSGWETLPEFDNYNETEMASQAGGIGATALLVHPRARGSSGESRPILSVSEPSRGRVMVLTTGASWRLGFAPDLPLVEGARPYDLLWLGAVRWLLRDETSGRLSLETDKPRYEYDEPIELQATTLTASYAAEPQIQVHWEVHPLKAGEPAGSVAQGVWTTDGLGRASRVIEDLPIGAYEAVARRSDGDDGGATVHEVRRVFLVEHPTRELALVSAPAGTERLRRLAELTGGEHIIVAEGQSIPFRIPVRDPFADQRNAGKRITARNDRPLWTGFGALVLLVLAFGTEWILRRRQGER